MARVPIIALALLALVVWAPGDPVPTAHARAARARKAPAGRRPPPAARRAGSAHRPAKARLAHRTSPQLAMLLPHLSPTWTSSTSGEEVVEDAEPEVVPPPVPVTSARTRLTQIACYAALQRLGVMFRAGPSKGLIAHPVLVSDPIAGVHFRNKYTKDPMLADCQLVLALYRSATIFRKHGVHTVLFSNTWRPPHWDFKLRRSVPRKGQSVGHHPVGLAMDASVLIDGKNVRYEVEADWEKAYGGPGNCVGPVKTAKGRKLRQIICDLEEHHVFRRVLTPDSDYGHRNHFHISAPLANESFVRTRWAGRTLDQPLPGDPGFPGWEKWYSCWQVANLRRRWACYQRHQKLKGRAPVRFATPKAQPRTAISLKVPSSEGEEPPADSRSVDPHGEARPAPRTAAPPGPAREAPREAPRPATAPAPAPAPARPVPQPAPTPPRR
jgi:hypothetical protein